MFWIWAGGSDNYNTTDKTVSGPKPVYLMKTFTVNPNNKFGNFGLIIILLKIMINTRETHSAVLSGNDGVYK